MTRGSLWWLFPLLLIVVADEIRFSRAFCCELAYVPLMKVVRFDLMVSTPVGTAAGTVTPRTANVTVPPVIAPTLGVTTAFMVMVWAAGLNVSWMLFVLMIVVFVSTAKGDELIAVPAVVITAIEPLLAPVGTTTLRYPLEFRPNDVAGALLNHTPVTVTPAGMP